MSSDHLEVLPCPPGPAALDALVPALDAALAGTGPALALTPERPTVQLLAALRPDEPVEAPDIAAIVTTSGSSGEPKPVLLPAASLRASAEATLDRLGGTGQWLLTLPAQYIAGLQVIVRSLVGGTTPVTLDTSGGFTVDGFVAAAGLLDPGARRYTALVPTQLGRLLAEPSGQDALRGFHAVLLGGSAAPDGLLDRARALGIPVTTTYGMSETCGGCVYDGRPLPGVTAELRADGRILLAGPVLAAGYRLRPDLTAEAFEYVGDRRVHVTPDLGRHTTDGRLEILGRADHVAVSGGVNVPLAAVERALAEHPAVAAAACLAAADTQWGERVVAVVAPAAGAEPTLAELRAHVAQSCPRAWAPRELLHVPAIPLLSSGKVDRQEVHRHWAQHRTDQAGEL